MFPFANIHLDPQQKIFVTQAMLRVALVDEVYTDEEVMLIRTFYEEEMDGAAPAFATLVAEARQPMPLERVEFTLPEQRDLAISLCLMAAYADGNFTGGERSAILTIADLIGMPRSRFDEVVDLVQDHLLAQLSSLPDSSSVAKISEEMTK